jgi:hypothetical protein
LIITIILVVILMVKYFLSKKRKSKV